jgi:hypothetical protein
LLNQNFLLRIDCKYAKYILKQDVENIASKQIFARWQAILSVFILILCILKELIIPSLIFSLVNFCCATMASKKDREKGKLVNPPVNQPLAIKPESSPVGTPAASPIITSLTLTNRFMTFSPEPNVTFSSALATDFNPFLGAPQRPRIPFVKAEPPSAYVRLPYFQHLFFVEVGMAPIKDPSQLALAFFSPRFH